MRAAVASFIFLVACVPVEHQKSTEEGKDMSASCGAADFQDLVGQSESDLIPEDLPAPVRIIEPGMAVTMDYRPDRLNIEISEEGVISRVFCG